MEIKLTFLFVFSLEFSLCEIAITYDTRLSQNIVLESVV